ncbi:ABC transporter permease subunit [Catenovulum sp. 2E275]|nr:ABC transporter permease subunit [Catenovulum sp. 2E275]MCU4675396.1 ABC transporter permease subunit [Catenovulum sp. 2E275]
MVLVALLLIFFYLLYVVQPIFDDVSIDHKLDISITMPENTLALGLDDHVETAFRLTKDAKLEFYTLVGANAGSLVKTFDITGGDQISSFAKSMVHLNQYAYVTDKNQLIIAEPKFKLGFANNQRQISPQINYPLTNQGIFLNSDSVISKLAFAFTEQGGGVIYQNEQGHIRFVRLDAEVNFMTDETEWVQTQINLPAVSGQVDYLLMTADISRAFVVQNGQLFVFNTRDPENVSLVSKGQVVDYDKQVTATSLLGGANSIMIADSSGEISQWFEVNGEKGRRFEKIRSFKSKQAVTDLYPEYFRRSFVATSENGELGVYYTTSQATLFNGEITKGKIATMSVAPRADAYILQANKTVQVFDVHNEHPEVTWSALWNEVWYEGYSEPDYVWQSTSASDDFESKFSLVPITFGTIKAAFYAMLFSVPIALSAAIYTAYFMPAKIRTLVKPTVEIMEALPTVILGFLAGLWLAPLIETHLAALLVLVFGLPVCILLVAYIWHSLPISIKNRLPVGWDSLILIPVIILLAWGCIAMSPWLNDMFFDGDVRLFITDELGISFDQRNSLVVGIAMGFAVIPTIFSIAEDAVFSVPKHLSQGSLALGASQWQTLVRVVLLTASPGIFSAVMMGLGRAVGETMIVLMATGNTPIMDWSIFQGMRTLSANIAVEMPESEVGSTHYRILFLAAFVLFVFTFVFNTIAEFVRQRLRDKYSSL